MNSTDKKVLPTSWIEVVLDDINFRESSSINPGKSKEVDFELYSVPSFESDTPEIVKGKEIGSTKQIVQEGDILICKINPRINRVWLVNSSNNKNKIASSEWIVVNSNNLINPKYLIYVFKSPAFRKLITSEVSGVGGSLTRARPKLVKHYKIPLAPSNEQDRIVLKLDKLFSKIESIKERLDNIPELLKQFRQSVLTAAFTGKLTAEWREGQNFEWHIDLRNSEVNDWGWKLQYASTACVKVQNGNTPKQNPFSLNGDIPFLKVYNIQNQSIAFEYKPQFIKKEVHIGVLKKSRVLPNDILINIVGPPLGKVALVTDDYPEWNINQAIVLFRPKEYLLPKYLYYFLRDGSEIFSYSSEYKGSAGQTNISLTQCRNFLIKIPSYPEQKEIINQVEKLFSIADRLEDRINKLKIQIDILPQSLLLKALCGELVPQDPNDESVVKLLKRIMGEKSKLKKKTKKLL